MVYGEAGGCRPPLPRAHFESLPIDGWKDSPGPAGYPAPIRRELCGACAIFLPRRKVVVLSELKNKQHELFCLEIASGQNNTQAAINAGYSEKSARKTGNRLRTNADISARIDELMAEIASEKVADAKEVMEYLTSVMRGESQSSVLCLIGDGMQETIEKRPDEKERLKAAELLGKRYGLYTDKVDIDADMGLKISMDYGADTG